MVGYPHHAGSVVKGGRQVHEEWYLLWQVVYVVHSFAKEFITKSSTEGAQYSLETLCRHVGVDHGKAQAVIDLGIETKEYDVCFESKKGKSRPQIQNRRSRSQRRSPRSRAQAPKQTPLKRQSGPSYNRALFDRVIWNTLVKLGWSLDVGTRPTDHYFLPKGVERRRGFSNRKDYFDSTKLVINFIKTDSRWKDRPEVVEALELFDKLSELKDKLKLPKNLDVDELTRKLDESKHK